MKCTDVQEKLRSFVADELDFAQTQEILTHFESCEECRQKEEFFRGEGGIFLEAPEYEVPEGMYETVLERARQPKGRSRRLNIFSVGRLLNRTVSFRTAASFIITFILGLLIGAWGISLSNGRSADYDWGELAKLVGYYEARQKVNEINIGRLQNQLAKLSTVGPMEPSDKYYEARFFDKENKLIEERTFSSTQDMEDYFPRLFESYYRDHGYFPKVTMVNE